MALRINGTPAVLSRPRSNPRRQSSSGAQMIVMAHDTSLLWASINADLEAHLQQAIPLRQPKVVYEPMRHLVLAAPRTAAPALCLAACEIVGGQREDAMTAASALHLAHATSYTHEHLPPAHCSKPNPFSRTMGPHAYGPNVGLLTGDGILPYGFELLSKSDDPSGANSSRILRVIIEIARAAGSYSMVDGPDQAPWCSEPTDNTAGWVAEVGWKEGALCAAGAACGAILGGGSEDEIERLRRYGLHVGLVEKLLLGKSGMEDERVLGLVKELKESALIELKDFNKSKVAVLSGLVEASFSNM